LPAYEPTVHQPKVADLRLVASKAKRAKMNYTYLIQSKIKKWVYIGSTKDLLKRFDEHNNGKIKSTKGLIPFRLVYYKAYQTYSLARKREIELKKNGQQKEMLFRRLGL